MAGALGKRRGARDGGLGGGADDGAAEAERAVFRRCFEARFLPLAKGDEAEVREDGTATEDGAEAEGYEGEEWEGFESEGEAVMVVEHGGVVRGSASALDKLELKAFMVRRAPDGWSHLPSANCSSLSSLRQQWRHGLNPQARIRRLWWKTTRTRPRTSRTTSHCSVFYQNLTC